MKFNRILRHRFQSGFSLPEATLSVAITAFGITSILGLLPHGMETMRKAGNVSAETRIVQQIIGSVTQSPWQDEKGNDVLTKSYNKTRFYYDDLAVQLDSKNPGVSQTYVAEIGISSADLSLPGTSGSNKSSDPYLRRVTVKIANGVAEGFDFEKAKPVTYRTYASVVARSGK